MKTIFTLMISLTCLINEAYTQIYATFDGDTTKIWHANFGTVCEAIFIPIINTSQDTIYITECDTIPQTDCTCIYTVCTSLIGLSAGTYTAVITVQLKDPQTSFYAGAVTFTVLNPPAVARNIAFYQSGCLGHGDIVSEEKIIPDKFAMLTNYPNPFNPSTTIRYIVPQSCHVVLTIYNSSGQRITALLDENKYAGTYETSFDGHHLSSGVYHCILNMGNKTLYTKITLLK